MKIGVVSSYGIGFGGYSGNKNAKLGQNNGLAVNKIISNMGNNASGKAVSPAKSILQSLYEQKRELTESKNKLVSDTLAQNKSLEMIKPQLDSYKEKLKNLEEQIKQALVEETQKGIKDEKSASKKKETIGSSIKEAIDSGKNEDNIIREMHAIMAASTSKVHMDVVSSVKNKMERELKVISSEMKQDGFSLKSKDSRVQSITEKLGDLSKISNKVNTDNDQKQETVENSISDIINKQEMLQAKINTYNQNINPPVEQYPRALFNIMI